MSTETKSTVADNGSSTGEENAAAPLTLPQKLLKVAGEIPEIDKDGHNDFQNYDFASAENVLRKVREPLAAAGVLLLSNLEEVTERPARTPKGKDTVITTVRVQFTLLDTDSKAAIVAVWAGTGDDPSDKGIYKAYTGCIKTFLRMTFILPLGDDPEADTRADERHAGDAAESIPSTISAEAADRLRTIINAANLSDHLDAKLRSFGVTALTGLTAEQATAMYEWATAGSES